MAKRKRRRRAGSQRPGPPRKKQAKPKQPTFYQGEYVDGMAVPNHTVPVDVDTGSWQYPLLRVQHRPDEESGILYGLFFDIMHDPDGEKHWEWADRAPSWMDPHLFVRMCKRNKRIGTVIAEAFRKNDESIARRQLPELLDEVLQEYFQYMFEHFEEAKPFLIEWMVRNYAYRNV